MIYRYSLKVVCFLLLSICSSVLVGDCSYCESSHREKEGNTLRKSQENGSLTGVSDTEDEEDRPSSSSKEESSSTGKRVVKGALIGGVVGTGVGFLAGKTLPGLAIGAVTGGGLFGFFGGKSKGKKKHKKRRIKRERD